MSTARTTEVSHAALPGLLSRLRQAELPRSLRGDKTGALETLLREINETVLPRRLTISADGVPLGALIVANRRLIAAGLADEAPGETDTGTLAEVLRLICETGEAVTLTHDGRPDLAADPDSGASLNALRAALTGRHDASGARVLARIIAGEAHAHVEWNPDGDEISYSGDETWHAQLEAFASGLRAGPAGGADGGLLVPLEKDLSLIACGDAETGTAALMPVETAFGALKSWQDIMGARSD